MTPPDSTALAPLKPVDFLILLSLADEDRHGYGVLREIEATTNGDVVLDTGNLYRSMRRLVTNRWIERLQPQPSDTGDERRRYYRLTDQGRKVLVDEARRMQGLLTNTTVQSLLESTS